MKIHKLIKEDLSFMADYLAEPYEEYICFSNYPIGDKIADFVVLDIKIKNESLHCRSQRCRF